MQKITLIRPTIEETYKGRVAFVGGRVEEIYVALDKRGDRANFYDWPTAMRWEYQNTGNDYIYLPMGYYGKYELDA